MTTPNEHDPNYLLQLNAFHRYTETYYLHPNAKLLWFMLIDLCNKSGWKEWVQVDAERIRQWIGAKDVKAAYRARNALKEAGLLEFRSGHKGCPTRYRLLFFYIACPQNGTESGTQSGTENEMQNGTNAGHIDKLNKIKPNKTSDSPVSAEADAKPRPRTDYAHIMDSFNRICTSLPKVQTVNSARKIAIRIASQAVETFGGWDSLFQSVERSDFLTGRNGAWNGCCFDWILKPANLVKILEGNYIDKPRKKEAESFDGIRVGTFI